MSSVLTIQERIKLHETNRDFYKACADKEKSEEKKKVLLFNMEKEIVALQELYQRLALLQSPSFLLLIAPVTPGTITHRLAMSSPTEDHARAEVEEELLQAVKDGRFKPFNGTYHVIVVRAALYNNEKNVSDIVVGNSFVTDKTCHYENGYITVNP